MTINILTEETINKIAAGEVIERPANVTKELVENSLDAESTLIDVEIRGAGKQLIRVRDNGIGMTREELSLAINRHATSKIKNFEDIPQLNTLGFRGEALASVAAVCHLLIQSQKKDSNIGWEIKLTGGNIKESRAWSGTSGTNIEVKNLFFNTPARAKFLKIDNTEKQHIIKTIEELAIANLNVAFKISSDSKNVLNAPRAKNLLERLSDVLGNDITKNLVALNVTHPNIMIKGFVSKTENSMPTRSNQFLFVNNRPVKPSKTVLHSLYEAYKENLPSGRHPAAIIFLYINPSEIDVNVHPTKREIRFSKEIEIHDLLYRAVKNTINQPIVVSLSKPYQLDKNDETDLSKEDFIKENPKQYYAQKSFSNIETKTVQEELTSILQNENNVIALGQVFKTYVVAQKQDELLVLDQHAACERIRYEKYIDDFKKKNIPVQGLLLAITLELSSSKMSLIKENLSFLRQAGWEIEEFGTNTVRISALPAILSNDRQVKDIIEEVIDALNEEKNIPPIEKIEKIICCAC